MPECTPRSRRSREQSQDRVGHRADADLDHCAVLDIAGRDLGDRLIGLADLRRRNLDRRARDMHGAVDARRRQYRIAQREGHALIHLGDDHARLRAPPPE